MNVIITGGTHGLGKELVRAFLKEGHNVFTCARNISPGWCLQFGVLKDGQTLSLSRCDVANFLDVVGFIDDVFLQTTKIDVLINNAGVYGPFGAVHNTSVGEWKRAIEANLMGPVYFCWALIPQFRSRDRGAIINIAGGGHRPETGRSAYSVSKAAGIRFTEAVAAELSNTGVKVNAVAPGYMSTRLHGLEMDVCGEAAPAVRLCQHLAAGVPYSGRLISARRDDYRSEAFLTRMKSDPDFCTLRRVDR